MANERVLSIRILGDAASGTKALREVEAAGGKTAGSQSVLAGALTNVKSSLLSVVPGGAQAEQTLGKLGKASEGAGISMKGALVGGAAAAGVAIAGLTAKGVGDFARLTGEVTKYQRATGASAEESSRLIAVSRALGVDTDVLTGSMFKSGASIEANASKFEALGITIARNRDGTVDLTGTLENAAAAYQHSSDATTKDAIAKQLGGKRGLELLPILGATKERLDGITEAANKRGEIFHQDDLNKGLELRKALREVGLAGESLANSFGKEAAPAITNVAHEVTNLVDVLNSLHLPAIIGDVVHFSTAISELNAPKTVIDSYHRLSDAIGISHRVQDEFGSHLPVIGKYFDDHKKKLDDQAKSEKQLQAAVQDTARAEDQTAAAEARRLKLVNDLASAEESQVNAQLGVKKSVNDVRDANEQLAAKYHDLTEAVKLHGKNTAEAKAAQEAYDKTLLDAEGTYLDAAQKQADLAEQTAKAKGEAFDATQKHDAYRDALIRLKDTVAVGSPLRSELEGYINDLHSTPAEVKTVIGLDTKQAVSDFRQMERDFTNGITVPVTFDFGDAQAQFRQMERDFTNSVGAAINTGTRKIG